MQRSHHVSITFGWINVIYLCAAMLSRKINATQAWFKNKRLGAKQVIHIYCYIFLWCGCMYSQDQEARHYVHHDCTTAYSNAYAHSARPGLFGSLDHWVVGSLGRWVVGSLCRWVIGSLGRWVIGSLGRWVVGSLGRWVVGSLGRWVVGSLGRWVIGSLGSWVIGSLGRWVGRSLGHWVVGSLGRLVVWFTIVA